MSVGREEIERHLSTLYPENDSNSDAGLPVLPCRLEDLERFGGLETRRSLFAESRVDRHDWVQWSVAAAWRQTLTEPSRVVGSLMAAPPGLIRVCARSRSADEEVSKLVSYPSMSVQLRRSRL